MADTVDYETMSRAELAKLRASIDKAIASVGDREQRAALKAAEAAARQHGFSLTDLAPLMGKASGKGRSRGRAQQGDGDGEGEAKAEREIRFRNPQDHTQTWSGRGRRPCWYNDAEATGQPIEDMKAG